MLCPINNEIEACSDLELLRIYRSAVLRNYKGRFNCRIDAIIAEIQKRNDALQERFDILQKLLDEVSPEWSIERSQAEFSRLIDRAFARIAAGEAVRNEDEQPYKVEGK